MPCPFDVSAVLHPSALVLLFSLLSYLFYFIYMACDGFTEGFDNRPASLGPCKWISDGIPDTYHVWRTAAELCIFLFGSFAMLAGGIAVRSGTPLPVFAIAFIIHLAFTRLAGNSFYNRIINLITMNNINGNNQGCTFDFESFKIKYPAFYWDWIAVYIGILGIFTNFNKGVSMEHTLIVAGAGILIFLAGILFGDKITAIAKKEATEVKAKAETLEQRLIAIEKADVADIRKWVDAERAKAAAAIAPK